jgi:hypothetical protein
MRIVETDNLGGDYPDEKFLNLPNMTWEHAYAVVRAINSNLDDTSARCWVVVPNDYQLQPGFEP